MLYYQQLSQIAQNVGRHSLKGIEPISYTSVNSFYLLVYFSLDDISI